MTLDATEDRWSYLKSKGYTWHGVFNIVYPLVLVRWNDAYSGETGWKNVLGNDADCKPYTCETVGHIIKENRHSICLAQTVAGRFDANDTGRMSNMMTIPRGMIVSILELKTGHAFSKKRGLIRDRNGNRKKSI